MTSGYDLRHVHTKITEEEHTYHTLSLHLRARLVADKMADSVASFVRKQETFRDRTPQEIIPLPDALHPRSFGFDQGVTAREGACLTMHLNSHEGY